MASWLSKENTLEVILKVALQLSLDLSLHYTATSTSKENHELKLESKPKAKAYVEFKVTVMGKGLDSEGGIRGGLECEVNFHISFSKPPEIEGEIKSTPLQVYAAYFVDLLLYDRSGTWEYTFIEETELFKGPLLGVS